MSKYTPLFEWIGNCEMDKIKLTYEEILRIAGVPVDHSFLRYKKELTEYGYMVEQISMKEETIAFTKLKK